MGIIFVCVLSYLAVLEIIASPLPMGQVEYDPLPINVKSLGGDCPNEGEAIPFRRQAASPG